MVTPDRLRELAAAAEPRAGIINLFFVSPGPGVTTLLLIRHAQMETTTSMDDLHLTELGREQAEVLGQYLSHGKIEAVYASPTARARETAAPLARIHTVEVEVVADLRDLEQRRPLDRPLPELLEQEFGPEEAARRLERLRTEQSFDVLSPFLEPGAEFRARVTAAIDAIIERHPGRQIAVVTHAPVIMAYVVSLLASPLDFPMNPKLTSITRVLARDGRRTLEYINATPHLDVW